MHNKKLPFYCFGTSGIVLTENSVTADLQVVPKMLGPTSRMNYSCQNKKIVQIIFFGKEWFLSSFERLYSTMSTLIM
jgi:hypothetical protein